MSSNQQLLPLRKNHEALIKCEYCQKSTFENIFWVVHQSEVIYELINDTPLLSNSRSPYLKRYYKEAAPIDPISHHVEPKICCHDCYLFYLNSPRERSIYNYNRYLQHCKSRNIKPKL